MAPSKPAVVMDGEAYACTFFRGIWRYGYNVHSQLRDQIQSYVLLGNKPAMPLPVGAEIRKAGKLVYPHMYFARAKRKLQKMWDTSPFRRLNHLWQDSWNINNRAVQGMNLYHSILYNSKVASWLPHIVTVHDMMHERFQHICISEVFQMIHQKKEAIESADINLCVSQATADDLVRIYPETAKTIRVVHHGFDHVPMLGAPPSVPGKYALFVGERYQYKNFITVMNAMVAKEWPKGIQLRVIGQAFRPAEELLIRSMGLSDRIVHLGRISDEEMWKQYQNALCFLFPSLVEGFGFPVLEAQACQTPLLCSDIPVFRECAGEQGALFFDGRLAESVAASVAAIQEPELRRRLIQAGKDNITRFTWAKCARETMEVYKELLDTKSLQFPKPGQRLKQMAA